MTMQLQTYNGVRYIESTSSHVLIHDVSDVLALLARARDHDAGVVLLNEANLAPEFYALKTGLAGEVFQKFSNYGVRVAIVGSFHLIRGERFHQLMHEANRGRDVHFAATHDDALAWLVHIQGA